MELVKNVPISFKTKSISESVITCRLKTKATKYPIRIDFAIHIYYKKYGSSGTSVVSNVQSIYTSNKDENHEIKLKTPKFDKYIKSELLLYLTPGQRDSVFIYDTRINPTQQPNIPKTQSMVTINITPNLSYEKEEKHDKIIYENDIKIAITSIVRDEERNGNLIRFLNCCRELELYHSNIVYVFIEGDSSDNTFEILDNWIKERKGSILEKICKGYAPFPKDKNTRRTRRTIIFAELRNRLIDIIKSRLDAEVILMTDANYEWKGDLINSLMEVGSDISAPMVVKRYKDDKGNYIFYDTWAFRKDGKEFKQFYPYIGNMKFDRFVDIDSVGGCYLIKRKVLDAGVRYDGKTDSEHVYFCNKARKMGFSLKINPNIYVKKGIYK